MTSVPSLKLTAFAVIVGVAIGVFHAAIEAQSSLERLRRAAEAATKALEARKKAEEEQRPKGEHPARLGTPTGPQGRGGQPNTAPAATNQEPSSAKVEALYS